MRKQVFFGGLLVAMSLLMISCEKTVVNNNNWQIVDCYIGYDYNSRWRYTSETPEFQYSNHYYFAGCDISQLSSFIFTDGNVQVYLVEKNSQGKEMQRPLPFSRHREIFNDEGEKTALYTETYDYFYGVGWIEFNYTASDFAYEDSQGVLDQPEPQQFRVVMTW